MGLENSTMSQLVAGISIASQALDHQCMRHPSITKMHLMVPSFSYHSSFQCDC